MAEYQQVNEDVIKALRPPGLSYLGAMGLLALAIGGLLVAWIYQIRIGMGVAGISHPVGWGVYIGSFVFWIGIAHSGTLISAILYLVRSKWRTAISRSAEAMTLVAIATAGMFPLIHLGRFWAFYYILPYPSQRQVRPNFQSPLVLDMVAIFTYMTVSVIFFFIGMVPDLAAARDHLQHGGAHPWQAKLYRALALGWGALLATFLVLGQTPCYNACRVTKEETPMLRVRGPYIAFGRKSKALRRENNGYGFPG